MLSRNDQIKFAKNVLALESEITDPTQLTHLKNITSLIITQTNATDDIIVNLDEYLHEVVAIANGRVDNGWKDEFKRKLKASMDDR